MNRLDPGPCDHCGCTCKTAPKPSSFLRKKAMGLLFGVAVGLVMNMSPMKRLASIVVRHTIADKAEKVADGGRLLKQKAVETFRNLGK